MSTPDADHHDDETTAEVPVPPAPPSYEDRPIPAYQKALVAVYAAGWAAFVGFDWGRFVSDFWPVDKSSVGPNLVASVVQYTAIAITLVLVYPPLRRRVSHAVAAEREHLKAHISHETRQLHATVADLHARHDAHAEAQAAHAEALADMRTKLDALIDAKTAPKKR